MRGEQDDLILQLFVPATEHADHVARVPLLLAFAIEVELAGDVLDIAAIVAQRFDADLPQLRSQISGGH